jgi:hypothetical protein
VRCRMLRTKVQREITDISHGQCPRMYLRARCAGCFREAQS